jgi:hypothetical protein
VQCRSPYVRAEPWRLQSDWCEAVDWGSLLGCVQTIFGNQGGRFGRSSRLQLFPWCLNCYVQIEYNVPGCWICQGHSQVIHTVRHNQNPQIMMHGNLNLHLNVCASERLTSEANCEFNHTHARRCASRCFKRCGLSKCTPASVSSSTIVVTSRSRRRFLPARSAS